MNRIFHKNKPSKSSSDNKALFEHILQQGGWVKDRFGHYKKTVQRGDNVREMRVKMQQLSCRIEVKVGNDWIRMSGCYYSDISVISAQEVRIGSYLFNTDGKLGRAK